MDNVLQIILNVPVSDCDDPEATAEEIVSFLNGNAKFFTTAEVDNKINLDGWIDQNRIEDWLAEQD